MDRWYIEGDRLRFGVGQTTAVRSDRRVLLEDRLGRREIDRVSDIVEPQDPDRPSLDIYLSSVHPHLTDRANATATNLRSESLCPGGGALVTLVTIPR